MTMNVTNEEFQSVLKVASVLGADPNPPGVEIHSETGYMAPDDYSPPEEQLQAGLVALIPATISAPEMYADYLKMLNENAGVYGMEGGYSVGSDFTFYPEPSQYIHEGAVWYTSAVKQQNVVDGRY